MSTRRFLALLPCALQDSLAGLRSHTGAVVCFAAEEQQDMLRAVSSTPTIRSPTAKKFERELAKLRGSYTPS